MDPENFDDDIFNDFFTHAYIYDGHGGYKLLAPATPGDEIRPVDIDDAGVVLGWSGSQLALWAPSGALQTILPLPGEPLSQSGYGDYPSVQRNNLGQIVGVTVGGGVQLYNPALNAWTDITPSINGLGPGRSARSKALTIWGSLSASSGRHRAAESLATWFPPSPSLRR